MPGVYAGTGTESTPTQGFISLIFLITSDIQALNLELQTFYMKETPILLTRERRRYLSGEQYFTESIPESTTDSAALTSTFLAQKLASTP